MCCPLSVIAFRGIVQKGVFRWADVLSVFVSTVQPAGISPSSDLFPPFLYEFTSLSAPHSANVAYKFTV